MWRKIIGEKVFQFLGISKWYLLSICVGVFLLIFGYQHIKIEILKLSVVEKTEKITWLEKENKGLLITINLLKKEHEKQLRVLHVNRGKHQKVIQSIGSKKLELKGENNGTTSKFLVDTSKYIVRWLHNKDTRDTKSTQGKDTTRITKDISSER